MTKTAQFALNQARINRDRALILEHDDRIEEAEVLWKEAESWEDTYAEEIGA